jgi:hypothetical protein
MQAGLILGHGYVPEKCPQDKIQNFRLKWCISWAYGIDNSIL